MQINPICAYAPITYVRNTNTKKQANTAGDVSFGQREQIFVSPASIKILDNLFHSLYKAKQELGNTKVMAKGFEVSHKYPKNIIINMRKYDADTDTLIRLDDTVNGTALQVHIDKFKEDESIRFMVQMKDLKDINGNIHLRKGSLNDFHKVTNFVDRSDETENIDSIIETYLK